MKLLGDIGKKPEWVDKNIDTFCSGKRVICIGQIWQVVTNGFIALTSYHRDEILLSKDTIIEIRRGDNDEYKWHSRTTNEMYFGCRQEDIHKNCLFMGTISDDALHYTRYTLQQILDRKLYNYGYSDSDKSYIRDNQKWLIEHKYWNGVLI